MSKKKHLPTQPYKGTRDFYPKDWAVQNYIFKIWRKVCLSFGYEEYMGPLLENFEIFAAKSGEEIVNNQLYAFRDRGKRKIAIRPEMTPSVARMIAAREKELPKPIKWFSIANFYRYEKPQKNREREFRQVNVDILGENNLTADFEILQLNRAIMDAFGATPKMYEVRVNNRRLMDSLFKEIVGANNQSVLSSLYRLVDKKEKIGSDNFQAELAKLNLSPVQQKKLFKVLAYDLSSLAKLGDQNQEALKILELFKLLKAVGIEESIVYSPTTVRGLDYYDGIVFEQFDLNPTSSRSMFGGGRYNTLLNIFGIENYPAVGFAAGDATTRDFLKNWDLLPNFAEATGPQVLVTVFPGNFNRFFIESAKLARSLRKQNISVELVLQKQNLASQLNYANRKNIPYVIILGEDEMESKELMLKDMSSGQQEQLKIDEIAGRILPDKILESKT